MPEMGADYLPEVAAKLREKIAAEQTAVVRFRPFNDCRLVARHTVGRGGLIPEAYLRQVIGLVASAPRRPPIRISQLPPFTEWKS